MQDIGRQKEIKELLAETDRRIEELRAILADMDEIAALRRRRGEPESDDYNGFRRSDVLELLGRQQERRAALAAELQRQNAEEAPKERTSLSAALEKLYEALSADVGRARREFVFAEAFALRRVSDDGDRTFGRERHRVRGVCECLPRRYGDRLSGLRQGRRYEQADCC